MLTRAVHTSVSVSTALFGYEDGASGPGTENTPSTDPITTERIQSEIKVRRYDLYGT
jgi:hypothetical protein